MSRSLRTAGADGAMNDARAAAMMWADDAGSAAPSGLGAVVDAGSATAVPPDVLLENNPIARLLKWGTCGAPANWYSCDYAACADAFAFSICASPVRLVLMSARGARMTTGSPKFSASIAVLKSLGTIQEIFRPKARSTSSGSMSQPFLT